MIIGGGFGGVAAARAARASLDRVHEVFLLDRNRKTYLCGSFPMLIVGERETRKVTRSLSSLRKLGINYVETEARAVDTKEGTVTTAAGKFAYDYLVLAAGAEYDWEAVPGAREAHSFYDFESARRLRQKLRTFRRGRVIVAVSGLPYKCPPAPFEAAMLLNWAFRRRAVRKDIEIHVFTPEPAPLPIAGPEAGAQMTTDLNRRGIELHTNVSITEVARTGREASFGNGTSIDADIVITIPVHRAPDFILSSGLNGPSGWIPVQPNTLQTSLPNAFAIGDVNLVPMANGRGLPKAGLFASAQGETVGHNIAALINGTKPTGFQGIGHCFIVYSGSQAGMVQGEFLAPEKPRVTLMRPSARGLRAKEQFERDWLGFDI